MSAVHRIQQTRHALVDALAARDWQAISELDIECRQVVSDALVDGAEDEAELRSNLEQLLDLYQQLLTVSTGERQAIVDEMSQITQAQKAAKVYHLFG
ncbi:flagellar protein FliT [Pseudomonas frederiksbergensis]|jgi:hypothetical protein|uniref:flagellar protein FliT n=1 Tax=Pseudomonas frederiksbergensis TaxID=104087 RepID=UPI000958161D|nr:flagellar protein FliT [Pseudomonas frederiksbergensis]APV41379.1 flagellar protein FliT [Pseudomonas frederiksbergensis]